MGELFDDGLMQTFGEFGSTSRKIIAKAAAASPSGGVKAKRDAPVLSAPNAPLTTITWIGGNYGCRNSTPTKVSSITTTCCDLRPSLNHK